MGAKALWWKQQALSAVVTVPNPYFMEWKMKKILLAALCTASLGFAGTAAAQCGTVQVGDPNWSTAQIIAAIDAFILSNGMGCDIAMVPAPTKQVVPLALGATDPLLVGEYWASDLGPEKIAELTADGVIDIVGKPFPKAGEFWFVSPAFAATYPELDTVEKVLQRPDLFDGKFYGCPVGAGWACEHSNKALFKAWGMEDLGWTLENPGSGEGLASIIIDAYTTDGNWFGYYWSPTAVAINNELVALDYDREFVGLAVWSDCYANAEPAPSCDYEETSFSPSTVVTLATPNLADYPEAYAYSKARQIPMVSLGAADAKMADDGFAANEVAVWYLQNYEDEWAAWVSEDVADAVRAAL